MAEQLYRIRFEDGRYVFSHSLGVQTNPETGKMMRGPLRRFHLNDEGIAMQLADADEYLARVKKLIGKEEVSLFRIEEVAHEIA